MPKGIFIVGTGTDIGKTVVTAGIMYILRDNGYAATYFKPALSGALEEGGQLIPGDTKLVCSVSGLKELYEDLTPYIFKEAVSPHLASKNEKINININYIMDKYDLLKGKYDYIVAEGCGGIACPLIDREDGVFMLGDLIKLMNMDVVLVADASLGTINYTVITINYIKALGLNIKGVIINNFIGSDMQRDNIKMIEKITGVKVISKFNKITDADNGFINKIRDAAKESFELEKILKCMSDL